MSTECAGSIEGFAYRRNAETKWILAAQLGYSLAFEELASRYGSRIYRLALRITLNQNDAGDVCRDTFVEAREHLKEFRVNSSFSLWLTRIGAKETLRKLRERHPDEIALDQFERTGGFLVARDQTEGSADLEKEYTGSELQQILSVGINRLKPISRMVFLLCVQEKCSVEDVADSLGFSVSAVWSSLLQARLEMRDYVERYLRHRSDSVSISVTPSMTKQKEFDNGRTVSSTASQSR